MLLALLCLGGTGCIRMASNTADNLLNGRVLPTSSQLMPQEYFAGTKLVAPELASAYFPLVLLDLPFEAAWDVLLLPPQYLNKRYKEQKKQQAAQSYLHRK